MKEVKRYQCEVCESLFKTSDEATLCEKRETERPLADVGQLISYKLEMSGGYAPYYAELRIVRIVEDGHYLEYHFEENYAGKDQEPEWHAPHPTTSSVFGNKEFEELCTVL